MKYNTVFKAGSVLLIEYANTYWSRFSIQPGEYNELERIIGHGEYLNVTNTTLIDALFVLDHIRKIHTGHDLPPCGIKLTKDSIEGTVARFALHGFDRVTLASGRIFVTLHEKSFVANMQKIFGQKVRLNPYGREDISDVLAVYESLQRRPIISPRRALA